MAYIKPQVLLHQEFSQPTNADETTMRAMIIGPNAILHRYSNADEKALIALGDYVRGETTDSTEAIDKDFPDRAAGGVVDKSYTKLYVDDALLCYYEDLTQSEKVADPKIYSDKRYPNAVIAEDLVFTGKNRSGVFGDRDVQIGDYAWVRSLTSTSNSCLPDEKLSKIVGFIPEIQDPEFGAVTASGVAAQSDAAAEASIVRYARATLKVTGNIPAEPDLKVVVVSADATNGYKVKVVNGSTEGEAFTVASGTAFDIIEDIPAENDNPGVEGVKGIFNNVAGLIPEMEYVITSVGDVKPVISDTLITLEDNYNAYKAGDFTPVYTITVDNVKTTVNCGKLVEISVLGENDTNPDRFVVVAGEAFNIGPYGFTGTISATDFDKLATGDNWKVTKRVVYAVPELSVEGTYKGLVDDTYIVKVVRGGTPNADRNTCPILEVSTSLGLDYAEVYVVTAADFISCGRNGLRIKLTNPVATGQIYTFNATAESTGDVHGLLLQKDLPSGMQSTAANTVALDLRLFKRDDIVLTEDNELTHDPNFEQEDTKVLINSNITISDPELPVDARLFGGKMYLEYREWSPSYVGEVGYCTSTDDLDLIPGQLSADNPMKYAVYKALANSNGVAVAYTAVSDNASDTAWEEAIEAAAGTDDVYSVTPTTQDTKILNKVAALINNESGAEQCRWKSGVFSVANETEVMVVGQNTRNNDLFTTSTDGEVVTAKFSDDDNTSGTQYTLMTVTSDNTLFKEWDVAPGDEVRIAGSKDVKFIVDNVLSDTSLLVKEGPALASDESIKIEIWHKLSKREQAERYGKKAGSFVNRRIMVVAPDKVGEAGEVLPGYYLAAAVSGCKAGVNAYQGLTRTGISGFDDYSYAKPYWTESQLDILASYGVCIVLEDANGTPYIRHALTTDMSTTATQEEVITRDYDYISKTIHSVLQEYIGKTNVTTETVNAVRRRIQKTLDDLYSKQYITSFDKLEVQQHALLQDRIEVYVTVGLPFPVNNIEVYVMA